MHFKCFKLVEIIVDITHYASRQVEFTLFEDSLTSVDLTILTLQDIISLYMK